MARKVRGFGAIVRNADSSFVEASCEQCLPAAKRPFHQRVAHLNLCRRCVQRLAARRKTPASIQPARAELWSLGLAYGALVARTIFYALLFWWASRSAVGDAALQGAVAADILTFLILGAFRIPFEGLTVTVDSAFEFVLIVFYLSRRMLFDVSENATFVGTSLLFFLAFAVVRLSISGAGQAEDTVMGS